MSASERDQEQEQEQTEWSKESVVKLITLYESHTLLWDTDAPGSRDRRRRDAAWRTIATRLESARTASEVERKVHALRGQFGREHRRLEFCRALGRSYAPKWYGYRHLLFTLKSGRHRAPYKKPKSNPASFKSQNGLDGIIPNTDESTHGEHTTNRYGLAIESKKKYQNGDISNRMSQNYILPRREREEITDVHRDQFSIYGEYVANELRSVNNEHARCVMKHSINTILFEGLMGKYDKDVLDIESLDSLPVRETVYFKDSKFELD